MQRLKQEWQKSPALGPGRQTDGKNLVWRNRKKISQIINVYLYLPFFILIMGNGFAFLDKIEPPRPEMGFYDNL
jgi:hypothetical protein